MENKVVKNTIMLYGMSIAKIVFPLITLPYLTRVLSLEGYGVTAYVKSVMQYMQIFIDFGFMLSGTKSIVEVRENAQELGKTAGSILLSRLLLSSAAFAVLAALVLSIKLLKENALFTLLSFIPVFLTVFLFDYLFRGLEQMQVITSRFVAMKGIAALLTFVFVKSDNDLILIPILDIAGTVIAVIMVYASIRKMNIHIRLGSIREAMGRLADSAVYFASNMATTAFGALNTVLIGTYLPTAEVAFWSVCMQMIGAIQTMYSPIIDGVYPEMVKSRDLKLIKKILVIFMPVIFAGTAFSYAIAPVALKIVGGAQYMNAAYLFRWLLPILIFSFPGMLLGWPTLGAYNLQKKVTVSTIAAAVFQVMGLLLLALMNVFTLTGIAVLRGLTELVLLLMRLFSVEKYIKRGEAECSQET